MTRAAVLVTGGATRIGAAIVHRFAEAGWHVVIHYRSSGTAAEALAARLPSAETLAFDLADDDAAVAAVTALAARLTDWRCLVNSASVFDYDGVTALDPATNRQAMQINALAPARLAQAFLAHAVSAAPRCVINITDMKIENTNPDFFSYTMSKHALAATIGMMAKSESFAGSRIYGLAPGAVLASHDQREEETDISHRMNLLGRKTGADEIAGAALFLASGALASGQTLFVDSGQHLLDQPRDVIWLARELAAGGGVIRHAFSTRLWHWVNAAALIVLFMTGLNISNGHRYLYWGNYGFDPKDAWLAVVRFPGWATIPGHYNLAVARDWHILAAWPFGVGLLFIWIAMLVNGHFRRDLTTRRSDWTPPAVIAAMRAHSAAAQAGDHGYNAVQKILYGMVLGVLLPLMVLTGLAISPGFEPGAPWLIDLLGGRQSARSLHFLAAWGLFGFFVIHILLALANWRLILEMVTGGRREAPADPAPLAPAEGAPEHG